MTEELATLDQTERKRLARDAETSGEILAQLATDPSEYVRWAVAANPSTPAETFAALQSAARAEAEQVLSGPAEAEDLINLARNPATPSDVLTRLSTDESIAVRGYIADNPKAPSSVLSAFAATAIDGPDAESEEQRLMRYLLSGNPGTPAHILDQLAHDRNPAMRERIASNAATPAEALDTLAQDGEHTVRWLVAQNTNTPAQALEDLAQSPDAAIREKVAENPNTPASALGYLLNDKNSSVHSSTEAKKPQQTTTRGTLRVARHDGSDGLGM